MTFNQAVEKIMPEVENGSKEPFMVYRDNDGTFHCDFTQNQYGEKFDWVDDIQDPFAVTLTGAELAGSSFPSVYDRILNERLRAEYEKFPPTDGDFDEPKALMCLMEENIGEFSSEVTDYLTLFDRPFAALYEMTPMSLVSDDPDLDYDPDLVSEFVGTVEDEVHSRLHERVVFQVADEGEQLLPIPQKAQPEKSEASTPKMRSDDGYAELHKISINSSDIIISENPDAEYRYMVLENRYTPYYNETGENNIYTGFTNDFLKALTEFT